MDKDLDKIYIQLIDLYNQIEMIRDELITDNDNKKLLKIKLNDVLNSIIVCKAVISLNITNPNSISYNWYKEMLSDNKGKKYIVKIKEKNEK